MNKDTFIIEGLAGKKTLRGEVEIFGAKNDVLKAMAAAVLFKDPITIRNVPANDDVSKMTDLLLAVGANVTVGKKRDLTISSKTVNSTTLDPEITRAMRASVVLAGPLLARYGKTTFPAPGGCVIGARPVDFTIDGFQKMGAKVEIKDDQYVITAPGGKLKGADIFFNVKTVGGTETLMMAAVLAKGKTVLKNCAMEPEIVSLAQYLVSCGAKIKGAGTTTIEIVGGALLNARKKPYMTIPDRIETGSWLLLGALCASDLKIKNCAPENLEVVINMLKQSGVPITVGKDTIEIRGNGSLANNSFKAVNVKTHEYPGFPTDLQSPMVTFLTQVSGESVVFETIYEGRFKYIQNLEKLGAGITVMNPREILIKGNASDDKGLSTNLKALDGEEELDAYDIRAGFAAVMAALTAKGTSVISNVSRIDRGYESLETRLAALGANIRRVHGVEREVVTL